MNHIGTIIQAYRSDLKMNRKKLSENVCSEKYLYLIEKGERTPSAEIVRLFSDKLGVDLFDYYKYLDCMEPIKVSDAIKQFNTYRRTTDFEALKKYTQTISSFPDFQNKPWSYEIEVNIISYMVFVEQKYNEAVIYIEEILNQVEAKYSMEEFVANLYVLLSTCYQIFNDITNAKQALSMAEKVIKNKQNIARYNQIIVTIKLNTITLCHLSGEYDRAIEEGLWINRFQLETNSYERTNFTYYYLAYAYFKKGMQEEAFPWFEKCLFDLLIHHSPISAYYISNYDLFYELLQDNRISRELVKKVKQEYDFI